MAKTPIGLGQFSGRVGGVVYAVQAGRQVVRAYQPVVSNPKSTAQSIQRAKGNLVGRISKITPWQILEGLGDNKFNRRSRFLRLLLQKTTAGQAAGDPSTFNAKLNDTDFVFSEGTLVPAFRISYASAALRTISVQVGRTPGLNEDVYASQGILVVVVIKQSTGVWEEVQYRFVSASEITETAASLTFQHRAEGDYTASVYIAPFGSSDGSKLPTVSGDLTSTVNSLDALLSVGSAASSVVWGASSFETSATFTASQTSANSDSERKSKK